jgi:heme exporter protein D
MDQPDAQTPPTETAQSALDPTFKAQVQRLHQLTVYGRWLLVSILWISLGSLSLWGWRYELSLMRSRFTWAALRYGVLFNPWPALGLTLCIGVTLAVLVWQSRNILLGIPRQEQKRLEQQVRRIGQQGASHPLWKWVCKP